MEQLRVLCDDRLVINRCVYCGGLPDTRDHVPSRVFLNRPLPENLPVVGACHSCNNGFSKDEQYVACVIEAVLAGSSEPEMIKRMSIADILRDSPGLRARIEAAKFVEDDRVYFSVEPDRIRNVALKLARGHAAFELNRLCREEPSSLWCGPLELLSPDKLDAFEAFQLVGFLGEIGTRNTQRLQVLQMTMKAPDGSLQTQGIVINDWIEAQEGCYRYIAVEEPDHVAVRIVISEYLACEVVWKDKDSDWAVTPLSRPS